jgi:hypothetical protein
MKIYQNLYSPHERYFFYLHGKYIEAANCTGMFHIHFCNYDKRDVINDKEHFLVVGEISEKEITEFILSKVVKL